jgi:hypothetical protein
VKYECELAAGQHLELDNDGDQTVVSFSSRGLGQQQSQGHGITTGQWSKTPTVFRVDQGVVVRVETGNGPRFLQVEGNETTLLQKEPHLESAERIPLKEAPASNVKPMKPMEPMQPMRPMRPMEPMKPMRPMN